MSIPMDMLFKDNGGNVIAEFNLPDGYTYSDSSEPSTLLYNNDETGDLITFSFTTGLRFGELLETGRQVPFGDLFVYTDSQTISFEAGETEDFEDVEYSHNIIPLGEDIYNNNRVVYSVIEYGDVPRTYREMYFELSEGCWMVVYSTSFQQDGIFNTDAVYEQIDLYNCMF